MESPTAFASEPRAAKLTRDEVGFFCNALASARGQFDYVTRAICDELSLGPRGPWIIGLIGSSPLSPLALSTYFNVGRSLITAEINRLSDAGLIMQVKNESDGRRITLSLTPAGEMVHDRLGDTLHQMLTDRLSGYSHDQIMLCAQMLSDFARRNGED